MYSALSVAGLARQQ